MCSYMEEYKDFTLDEHNFPEREMQEFVHRLHEDKQHYVLIIDPAIKAQPGYKVYDEALKEDLFIKNADGTVLVGKVWPGLTAFPDFLHPKTQQWCKSSDLIWFNGVRVDLYRDQMDSGIQENGTH